MVRKYRKAKGIMEAGVSSTYMQLRSRRIIYIRSEKPISEDNNRVSSSNLSSCCESNEFIDLEVDDKDGETETSTYQRSTKRKLFENLRENKEEEEEEEESMENCSSPAFESTIKESSSSNCCCSGKKPKEEMTKSTIESEIEDFFAQAEKKINDKFKKKYNFDFEKEKPLEGRYEWVKLE